MINYTSVIFIGIIIAIILTIKFKGFGWLEELAKMFK